MKGMCSRETKNKDRVHAVGGKLGILVGKEVLVCGVWITEVSWSESSQETEPIENTDIQREV